MSTKTIKIQMSELLDESALDYCRGLIEQGVKPSTRLEVYRGNMLCLIVAKIGQGAKITSKGDIFVKYEGGVSNKQARRPWREAH